MKFITDQVLNELVERLLQSHWEDCFEIMSLDDLLYLRDHTIVAVIEEATPWHSLIDRDQALTNQLDLTETKLDSWLSEMNDEYQGNLVLWKFSFEEKLEIHNQNDITDHHFFKKHHILGDRLKSAIHKKQNNNKSKS
jgi:hypothetical protein